MAPDVIAKRVLIVEDEAVLAMHLEDTLADLGHTVAGWAVRIDEALALAREVDADFAVLDVNLFGTRSLPVADILHERGIPFVFTTGYGTEGLPDGYRDSLVLRKPYGTRELAGMIARLLPPAG